MAVGALETEGDLERFIQDRFFDDLGVKIRQLQDPGYGAFVGSVTGDGATTVFDVTHGLGSYDVHVTVYADAAPKNDAAPTKGRQSEDVVRLTFAPAPALGVVYNVVVSR